MKIAGIQKNSFIDYPGKIAAVLFTPGCNFNCFFCHNRQLIDPKYKALYTEEEVLEFLEKRKGMLDAVVISGGEPTLQPDLYDFIQKIRCENKGVPGYSVKLDTNGSRPDVIRRLLADEPTERAVDYIAMDIKAPLRKYDEICGVRTDTKAISESIGLIMGSGVPCEFRTTVVPQLEPEDIMEMAGLIRGAGLYALQQYRKPQGGMKSTAPNGTGNMVPAAIAANGMTREDNGAGKAYGGNLKTDAGVSADTGAEDASRIIDIRLMKTPYSKAELDAMADSVRSIVHNCIVRGV